MARARNKKKNTRSPWLGRLVQFVLVPLFIWFLAFVIWFNWSSIAKLFSKANLDDRPPAKNSSRKVERVEKTEKSQAVERGPRAPEGEKRETVEPPRTPAEPQPAPTKERILDEDRKRLEELLKNK